MILYDFQEIRKEKHKPSFWFATICMYHSDKTYIFYTAVLTLTVWAEEDSSDFSKGHCAGETEKYCVLSLYLLFTFKYISKSSNWILGLHLGQKTVLSRKPRYKTTTPLLAGAVVR